MPMATIAHRRGKGETHTTMDSTSKKSVESSDEKDGYDDGFEDNLFSKVLFQQHEEHDTRSNNGSAPFDSLNIPREEQIE